MSIDSFRWILYWGITLLYITFGKEYHTAAEVIDHITISFAFFVGLEFIMGVMKWVVLRKKNKKEA